MRINLGCGFDKREGYLNVDKDPSCEPDQIVDLDVLPWPWEDNAADEVLLKHVLEHLGADTRTYLDIIKELWRIAKPSATVTVIVPHPRHDHFVNDPTHVRAITPADWNCFPKPGTGSGSKKAWATHRSASNSESTSKSHRSTWFPTIRGVASLSGAS